MIDRLLQPHVIRMASWFPVVSVTGPRQSGKSTLVRAAFPDYEYLNLESPALRAEALEDPMGFIHRRGSRLIIDEAQYAPELFSAIQVESDERGETGQYILTGSQNFLLYKRISQSLAGRVGVLTLLPFSHAEVQHLVDSVDDFMVTGGYPRMYDAHIPAELYYSSYINTYVERDLGDVLNVRNLSAFRSFLSLLATHVGALANYSAIGSSLEINANTAKSWISVLESSYVTFRLPSYHRNLGKRVIKTPKLYFYDTGLLCHLLGIRSVPELFRHALFGQIVENLVIAERMKHHLNLGKHPDMYFYRDDSKREIDLLDMTEPNHPLAAEIKSAEMFRSTFAKHLTSVGDEIEIPENNRLVVYRGTQRYPTHGISLVPIPDFIA